MVCAMRRDWSIPAADPVVMFLLVLVIGITSAPGVLSAPLWCRSLGGCGRPSSGKLLHLYHRDDQDLLVSDRLICARLAIHCGADRTVAALAGWRIEAGACQRLCLLRGVHHRTDHAPGAAVQDLPIMPGSFQSTRTKGVAGWAFIA
jgi:hypothetical protein